jgi:hypothetical protein
VRGDRRLGRLDQANDPGSDSDANFEDGEPEADDWKKSGTPMKPLRCRAGVSSFGESFVETRRDG